MRQSKFGSLSAMAIPGGGEGGRAARIKAKENARRILQRNSRAVNRIFLHEVVTTNRALNRLTKI
jgi:hypothetical protein